MLNLFGFEISATYFTISNASLKVERIILRMSPVIQLTESARGFA